MTRADSAEAPDEVWLAVHKTGPLPSWNSSQARADAYGPDYTAVRYVKAPKADGDTGLNETAIALARRLPSDDTVNPPAAKEPCTHRIGGGAEGAALVGISDEEHLRLCRAWINDPDNDAPYDCIGRMRDLMAAFDRLRARERKLRELVGEVLEYQGDRLPPGWRLKLRAALEEP